MRNSKSMKIAGDLLWSILALTVMNGVIQIIVYPMLNRKLGTEQYGNVLYLVSVASIFSAGIGLGLNNARLLRQKEERAGNAEYFAVMAMLLLPSLLITWFVTKSYVTPGGFLMLAVLTAFMTLRYYSDVEYRLSLNYKGYFVYYVFLSLGYGLGLLLWNVVPVWGVVFLLGETACVAYCAAKGSVYRPMQYKGQLQGVAKLAFQLVPSYVLYNLVIQMDRIMLRTLVDSSAVTIYYVASLLGKVIALLVGPLNSIIISYLTKSETKLNARKAILLSAAFLGCSAAAFAAICVATPLVVRLLYPDIYVQVMELAFWANLGQVICFSASLVLTVLLTIAPAYWQMIIQSVYAVVFLAGGYLGVQLGALKGFVFGTLLANVIRLAGTFAILMIYALKKNPEREES